MHMHLKRTFEWIQIWYEYYRPPLHDWYRLDFGECKTGDLFLQEYKKRILIYYKRLKNKTENNSIWKGRFIKVNELKLTQVELF